MRSEIEDLKNAILSKEKEQVLSLLDNIKERCQSDVELANEITMPVVITELHRMLVENLGVHQRALMIKGRIPNRVRRAYCFSQAMINGVSRS